MIADKCHSTLSAIGIGDLFFPSGFLQFCSVMDSSTGLILGLTTINNLVTKIVRDGASNLSILSRRDSFLFLGGGGGEGGLVILYNEEESYMRHLKNSRLI